MATQIRLGGTLTKTIRWLLILNVAFFLAQNIAYLVLKWDPVTYYLEAGQHTLKVKQREDGTKLDRILITDDMQFVPN